MTAQKQRPTDEEFADLARRRDEVVAAMVKRVCEEQGWDFGKVTFHASHTHGCYCACPDGPCQHTWNGPQKPVGLEEGEPESEARGWSVSCSRCGALAIDHDLRVAP